MNDPGATPLRIDGIPNLEPRRTVPESITTVFAKVQPILVRVVRRRLPEYLRSKVNPSDLVQDVLFRLHLSGVTLKDKDEKWRLRLLFRGVRFRVSNVIRYFDKAGRLPDGSEQSYESLIESGQFDGVASPSPSKRPSEVLCLKESIVALKASISKLEPLDRQIVTLNALEFVEFSEIARRLGLSERTVRNRFRKSLKRLRTQLSVFDPDRSDVPFPRRSENQESGS